VIDVLTLKKQTPLHLASGAGQLEVCRLLLELGADIDATDDSGQKPIHAAAMNNYAEVAQLFLQHHPSLVMACTKVCNANTENNLFSRTLLMSEQCHCAANVIVKWLALRLYICEVSGLNLFFETGYPNWEFYYCSTGKCWIVCYFEICQNHSPCFSNLLLIMPFDSA
jgi:hypothetical protein